MCQKEGDTGLSGGMEYRRVKKNGTQVCQQEVNTYVSGREDEYVRRKGIQVCYEKGNTCVLGKREYMCVRKKGIHVC